MASASTIANRRFDLFDAELELRDYDAAALSATTSGTAKNVPVRFQRGYKAVVDVAAYTGYVAGTAQWEIAIQVSDVSGGTYTTVGSIIPAGTAGRFEIPLSGEWVEDRDSDAAWVRVTATKTGAAGNLTYGVFLCSMM